MKRHDARELALQALFAVDLGKNDHRMILESLCREKDVDENGREFCGYIVEGVIARQAVIDQLIQKYAVQWELTRMAGVDRNILRLALFEILFSDDVPEAVATNEAIELSKSYGSQESPRFINGILGNILKELPAIKKAVEEETGI